MHLNDGEENLGHCQTQKEQVVKRLGKCMARLLSWRDFACVCFRFGDEAVNATRGDWHGVELNSGARGKQNIPLISLASESHQIRRLNL